MAFRTRSVSPSLCQDIILREILDWLITFKLSPAFREGWQCRHRWPARGNAFQLSPYRPFRFLVARYLRIMLRNPDLPAEKAFQQAITYFHISLTDEEFLELFFEARQACFCIMLYYREKIIRTLLHAGIDIHVYGDSWKAFPLAGHRCLHCHPSLNAVESFGK